MRWTRLLLGAVAALLLPHGGFAIPAPGGGGSVSRGVSSHCDRDCMTVIVDGILNSLVAHDPYSLPLAQIYRATENSHPAALHMMTLWRTVTRADGPNLLAIDTKNGSAYFALDISEGSDERQSVLWARIKVSNREITELELYVNRNRGDHGFSFSPKELPKNYLRWMNPPSDRTKASRTQLESLGAAIFNTNSTFSVTVASDCQFTEEGWTVIDPGPDRNESYAPVACSWTNTRPTDSKARTNLVIDEEFGIVVTGAVIPGKVYPYGNISAFIPNHMTSAQELQQEWFEVKKSEGAQLLLNPTSASGETLQVLQYYNNSLQGQQVMLYLSGPDMESAWVQ
ncbi:uncharacterized protein N7483_012465 [Penicillium malachiteum]|uniref:uncharacterized protein n=1 Tax=Penicillium malachiteum TaxID=1324776 RepID=UPI002549767E|nr:uncharacterized protein N7483_012465 [Penicillium malachiteum]KAJ5715284.1 hypothetical protein N7483_012465 [Penicillium malachiteum]